MIDLYLRTETEADMVEALPFARQDDEWIAATHDYALDIIGPVVAASGENDDPLVVDPGFHANLRCSPDIAARVPPGIIINPDNPVRVWA